MFQQSTTIFRAWLSTVRRLQQALDHGGQIEPAVGAVRQFAEVTSGILVEFETTIGTLDRARDVAKQGVDSMKALAIGALACADDDALVGADQVGGGNDASQPAGDQQHIGGQSALCSLRQRRDVVLGLRQVMDPAGPQPQRQARGLENRACRKRRLFAARRTLPPFFAAAVHKRMLPFATVGANETVRPPRMLQGRFAPLLRAGLSKKRRQRQFRLKLDLVDRRLPFASLRGVHACR